MYPGGSSNRVIVRREYMCTLQGCKEQIVEFLIIRFPPRKEMAPHFEAQSLTTTAKRMRAGICSSTS